MSKRRGANEGSITQRKDGRWFARLHLGYAPGGRRIRKSYYAPTREAVAEMLTAAKAQHDKGLPVAHGKETVGAYLASWVEAVRGTVRPRTWEAYELHVRKHMAPISKIRLAALRPEHIRKLLRDKELEGMSATSRTHLRTILNTALRAAVNDRLISWNPVAAVKRPKQVAYKYTELSADHAQALLAAAEKDRFGALFALMLATGLRRGEALGLRWIDVNLESRTLRVEQAVQRLRAKVAGKSGHSFAEPKSMRSRRTIVIPSMLIPILKHHRARQLEDRLLAGTRWRDSGLVFTSQNGGPADPTEVHYQFKACLRQADIPTTLRLHDLRHASASFLLKHGASLRTVMEVLGHSTITLTANTYGHVAHELMADAAARMDEALTK